MYSGIYLSQLHSYTGLLWERNILIGSRSGPFFAVRTIKMDGLLELLTYMCVFESVIKNIKNNIY